jgi:hypothetical protein
VSNRRPLFSMCQEARSCADGRLLCRPLGDVAEKVQAERRVQEWGVDQRRVSVAADAEMRAHNAQAADPKDHRHHFSKLYLPRKGMFCEPPRDLQLGSRLPVRLTLGSN